MKEYKITQNLVFYVEAESNDEALEKWSELDNSAATKNELEVYEVSK